MITPRYLPDVIDEVLREVPATEMQLIARLKDTKSSAVYAAPEAQYMWWLEFASILQQELGNPQGTEWKEKIQKIVSGGDD